MASTSVASNSSSTSNTTTSNNGTTLSDLSSEINAAALSMYYNFFYKQSYMTYLIPMIVSFCVYYIIYIPLFRRSSVRVRSKLLSRR